MDKKKCCCFSYIKNIDSSCEESFSGITNKCVVIFQKEDKVEEITLDVLLCISKKENIPIEKIYASKNGEIGLAIELLKRKNGEHVDRFSVPFRLVDENGEELKFKF